MSFLPINGAAAASKTDEAGNMVTHNAKERIAMRRLRIVRILIKLELVSCCDIRSVHVHARLSMCTVCEIIDKYPNVQEIHQEIQKFHMGNFHYLYSDGETPNFSLKHFEK